MTKENMTYWEQLRHPNWQKLRLRMLDRADYKCANCNDTETHLHVHHKQYIKGRKAWEYEDSNFEVLCDACHENAHYFKDSLNSVLAQLPSELLDQIRDLVAGFYSYYVDYKSVVSNFDAFETGDIANVIQNTLFTSEMEILKAAILNRNPYEAETVITFPKRERPVTGQVG